ncbi:hypothetical protein BDV93DRAFT_567309 [Ceratobasidium sp. AG-I]|nr:hypothetical protein BDV93DRAFT_567309 [Ceratobasidium sp. AG-I]
MSYTNDLSENGSTLYAGVQIAFAFTFACNLAVVSFAVLAPLLKKEAGITHVMLASLGSMLFLGLILMSVAFGLLLKAKFTGAIYVVSLVLIVFVISVMPLYMLLV